MEALVAGVNWLAVGVGTVLSFGLGALWFSPKMFGVKWAAGVGIEISTGAKQPIAAMAMQFVGTLLLAWIIALAVANDALPIGILFVVTSSALLMASNMFGQNSRYATLAEGSFVLTMAAIMIACQLVL